MRNVVANYIKSQQNLFKYFNCPENYLVRPMVGYNWQVFEEGNITFFSYWKEDIPRQNAVIVKKDGFPQIYKAKDYTMVVAIDCIKTAFVMKNTDEEESITSTNGRDSHE